MGRVTFYRWDINQTGWALPQWSPPLTGRVTTMVILAYQMIERASMEPTLTARATAGLKLAEGFLTRFAGSL